jgi:molecular chaperone GrpE
MNAADEDHNAEAADDVHNQNEQSSGSVSETANNSATGESDSNTMNNDECVVQAEPLKTQLKTAVDERDSYFEQLKRSQAELDNFRKRAQKEADQARRYQAVPLIRDVLPGLDNLGRAIQAAESSGKLDELIEGVKLVAKQFEDFLTRHSVVPISAVGEDFDPNRHEAVGQVPSAEHPPMTVIEEVERGFLLHDRVIRPSKVLVSCSLPDPSTTVEQNSESD